MSKLSPAIKALINAPAARPHAVPAPANITSVYQKIQRRAQEQKLAPSSWLALSTAATVTMNSPASLSALYTLAARGQPIEKSTATVELMREVGLKCMSIIGIPRVINCLNAFREAIPDAVGERLSTEVSRDCSPADLEQTKARGRELWNSIYKPFEQKLVSKLGRSHPDMPVVILNNHYSTLLSNPESKFRGENKSSLVGRLQTSMMAIACLRAQTGCAPQVLSHIYGIRKALEDGSWAQDLESEEGAKWLASDEGNEWMLQSVDEIVESIGQGSGTTFAPASRTSKL